MTTVTFFGGVRSASIADRVLAYEIGTAIGRSGFTLQHGGYNGLMEDAARGAADTGGTVVAVTLSDTAWGEFNPHVTDAVHLPTMGARLHRFLDGTDLVIAMGGGVGTLHELSAAIWYSGNIRPVPVWLAGAAAVRLSAFLRSERWLYESPTRPLGFVREIPDQASFDRVFRTFLAGTDPTPGAGDLDARVRTAAQRRGEFLLPDGRVLEEYFDEYLLAADPRLLGDVSRAMLALLPPDTGMVVGLELGGIPLTVALSASADVAAGFLRREPKTYGTCRRLEGHPPAGRHVVIVDDVVRTGSQMLDAAEVLRRAGAQVSTALCVLDRDIGGRDRLADHGIALGALLAAPMADRRRAS